jgi:TfoX/Sxy family transcriptional regulator of competence genes
MAFDERLARRVRALLVNQHELDERRMFGGLAFMLHGHMCCGILGAELMARVGPEHYEDALAQPHARVMDFTGRASKGTVMVAAEGIESDDALDAWIRRCVAFASTLPVR